MMRSFRSRIPDGEFMGIQLPSASFDASRYSIEHLDLERQIDLARFERLAQRLYPDLPGWLHQASSIYAMYMIFAAILVITLLCYYSTLETFLMPGRGSPTRPNIAVLLVCDAIFSYLSYQILTA